MPFMAICLLVLLVQVQASSPLLIRNRTVQFRPLHGKGGERLLQAESSEALIFVKTNVDPINANEDGMLEVAAQGVYLVREGSEYFNRMSTDGNAEYAEFLPEHKYDERLANKTTFLISATNDISHPNCTVKQIQKKQPKKQKKHFVVNCTEVGVAESFAMNPNVISIGSPMIDLIPLIFNESLNTEPQSPPKCNLPPLKLLSYDELEYEGEEYYGSTLSTVTLTKMLITDTGIDPTHGAFPHHEETRNVPGVTDTISLRNSHGTLVSGIAIGTSCNDGSHSYKGGISPGGRYVFGDITVEGQTPESMVFGESFFQYLFKTDIDIHSASWGGYQQGEYDILSAMYDEYIYDDPYTAHFFSAGNGGEGKEAGSPSTAKSVSSVGALDRALTGIAAFTSRKELPDGRRSVDVYAPGEDIVAPAGAYYPPGGALGHCETLVASGTSCAAPGAAALAQYEVEQRKIHYGVEKVHESATRAVANTRLQLPWKGNVFTQSKGKTPVLSSVTGDVAFAVELPEPQRVWHRCFYNTSKQMRLSLTWTDPPAMPYAKFPLINDLDVMIIHDDGMNSGFDGLHAHEVVEFETLSPFRVIVFAYGDRVIFPPVTFSVHVNSSLEVYDGEVCGECMPGDTTSDGCEEGQIKQCLPLGEYTNCSACEPGYLPTGLDEQCVCSPLLFLKSDGSDHLYQPCGSTRLLRSEGNGDASHNQLFGIFPYIVALFLML